MKVEFKAAQIAALLGGVVEGDPEAKVWNVARIEDGAPGMLSFLANPKYIHYLYETKSSIVLVNADFEPTEPVKATMIKVQNAYVYEVYSLNMSASTEELFGVVLL